ncbi:MULTISPECIES: NADH-quinone oxidoreductase subunit J [Candidatus Ichthyocystis]|uniref:NADH-quinone oxidoreductase subunit J n=1 Tax=Candidatus Ichthyocystis hellenicum TaxID=1561003 RepID=A0A0S4M3P8_9BURK|nr:MULTISPECIES: NADH-quinone oxidoreductase subunit J [Ichthyocystis]CUT17856.1 NADH-quinone oxidoreductase subunit J [Candidatus Ichthyocystis hellenicum]
MNTNLTFLFFIFFSLSLILFSSGVVFLKNPVHSAISLIASFVSAACIWLLLRAEFLAFMLILVYVGAVMVLLLFVVMMISRAEGFALTVKRRDRSWLFGMFVSLLLASELLSALINSNFAISVYAQSFPSQMSSVKNLGVVLFTRYFYPFELASILLFLGALSAVVLAQGTSASSNLKRQIKEEQLSVSAKDRVEVVSVPTVSPTSGNCS